MRTKTLKKRNVRFTYNSKYSEIAEKVANILWMLRIAFFYDGGYENILKVKEMVANDELTYRKIIRKDLKNKLRENINFICEDFEKSNSRIKGLIVLDDFFDVQIFEDEILRRLEDKCIEIVKTYKY